MTDSPTSPPPGWYHAEGDPPATERYWDGNRWTGQPRPVGGNGGTPPGQMPPAAAGQAPQVPGQPAGTSGQPGAVQPGPGQPTPGFQPPTFGGATPQAPGQPPAFGAPPTTGAPAAGQPPTFGAPGVAGGAMAAGGAAMGAAGAAMGGGAPGTESWQAAPGRELAGAGSRVGARLIDGIIVLIIAGLLGWLLGYVGGILGILIGFAYEAGLTATQGATLGKKMLGLGVLSEADNAYPPGWGPAATRWAVTGVLSAIGALVPALNSIFGLIAFIIVLVSLFFLFTDDRRKTVWDRVAKTVVVKV